MMATRPRCRVAFFVAAPLCLFADSAVAQERLSLASDITFMVTGGRWAAQG